MLTSKHNQQLSSELRQRAQQLRLSGVLANWDVVAEESWLPRLLEMEEKERGRRSLERRLKAAKLGRFKPMADFDWTWPKEVDRELVDELFEFKFMEEAANVILLGTNGVGKSMIAKNLLHQAILRGVTALALSASELLNDLAAQESSSALSRRLHHYTQPQLLLIDELGYLAGSNEHGDLLFEVVTRRYLQKPIIITTNKAFTEWSNVFPNVGCLVTLIDRLVHKSEIIKIEGESYRLKEAKERTEKKRLERSNKKHSPRKGKEIG